MLIIFLAEYRHIRAALIEQLGYNGSHTAEKMRPRRAAQSLAQTRHGDMSGKVLQVDFIARRRENQIDAERGKVFHVFFMVAGIAVEILMRRELSRIDEYRDHRAAARLDGQSDERKMPLMQRAHGRHQDDFVARGAPWRHRVPELRD